MAHGECDDYWDNYAVPHWFMHYLDDGGHFKGLTLSQRIDLAKAKHREYLAAKEYEEKWRGA